MPPIHPPLTPSTPLVSLPRPHPPRTYPKPLLRLQLHDLSHPGTQLFLTRVKSLESKLSSAVETVISTLYSAHSTAIPPTRSITLILRSMPGVAYTTGIDLDNDHKEIHLSTDYIAGIKTDIDHEVTGVLVHEMVHCWQWNGCGAAPGGLIEGIADFVRLKAGLAPGHWKREEIGEGEKWDRGYQHTAWFLEWVEARMGDGTVMRVNEGLKGRRYVEERFWGEVVGEGVDKLWEEYKRELENGEKGEKGEKGENGGVTDARVGGPIVLELGKAAQRVYNRLEQLMRRYMDEVAQREKDKMLREFEELKRSSTERWDKAALSGLDKAAMEELQQLIVKEFEEASSRTLEKLDPSLKIELDRATTTMEQGDEMLDKAVKEEMERPIWRGLDKAVKEEVERSILTELHKSYPDMRARSQQKRNAPAAATTEEGEQTKVTPSLDTRKPEPGQTSPETLRDLWVHVQEPDIDAEIPDTGETSSRG